MPAQEDDELVLAPAGMGLAQLEDRGLKPRIPSRLPDAAGPPAAVLEAACASFLVALEPDVKAGAAVGEVPRGLARVAAIGLVPPDRLQPPFRIRRKLRLPAAFGRLNRQEPGKSRTARDDRAVRLHRHSISSPPHTLSCTASIWTRSERNIASRPSKAAQGTSHDVCKSCLCWRSLEPWVAWTGLENRRDKVDRVFWVIFEIVGIKNHFNLTPAGSP